MKGQGKRSAGREVPAYFEGGQMPRARRLPTRGCTNIPREPVAIVNVGALGVFGAGATVDPETLAGRGLVRAGRKIKLLAEGEAPKNLTVRVHKASAAARAKIEAAGGKVESTS